jgi:hypothetical protein
MEYGVACEWREREILYAIKANFAGRIRFLLTSSAQYPRWFVEMTSFL